MQQYWEITHERAIDTQAVWGMQLLFELNNLTRTQHGTLTDSLPALAQTRDNKENDLTETLAAKHDLFAKLVSLIVRVPGLIDGLLEDDDPLKEQLDAIYAIDSDASEQAALRRSRLLLPLWTDVDAARAAAVPPKPALSLNYQGADVMVADFSTTIDAALTVQKTEAERQRDVTNAKTALRAADRKLDRGNKRWYQAWLLTFPVGTPEGDAAQSQITTEHGASDPLVLPILSATPLPDHTVDLQFDPNGGDHATVKELQYQLPGELEFGHSTPLTGNAMTVGPFTPGITVVLRTRVSNSNPGYVTSDAITVVVQ